MLPRLADGDDDDITASRHERGAGDWLSRRSERRRVASDFRADDIVKAVQ